MPLLAPEHCRREARVADNRVFLPRAPGANIAGLEKANAHDPIHGKLYHATVAARLLGRRTDGAAAGRAELQSMRADMIAGTPVQKGLNMSIWELRTQSPDKFAPLVPSDAQVNSGVFEFDGTPRRWKRRPVVEVYQEGRKKDHLPRGDVSLLLAGSLVLSQKAVDALGPFLAQFGQLLEAKVDDKIEYFYNVTRVIDCIDPDRSERRSSGSIVKEAFRADALPVGPTVFKDPRTARIRIYVNDEARQVWRRVSPRMA